MRISNQSYRPVPTTGDEFVSRKSAAIGDEEKRKTLRVDEIKIEGRIQKPQAFYILPRAHLHAAFESYEQGSWLFKIQNTLDDPIFQKK